VPDQDFRLVADVSSNNPTAIGAVLKDLGGATVSEIPGGFHVEATVTGASAQDCNRLLLSALRRIERRTRLRAEWSDGNVTQRFFDYVPKGTRTSA
jgi:hypothetical protein